MRVVRSKAINTFFFLRKECHYGYFHIFLCFNSLHYWIVCCSLSLFVVGTGNFKITSYCFYQYFDRADRHTHTTVICLWNANRKSCFCWLRPVGFQDSRKIFANKLTWKCQYRILNETRRSIFSEFFFTITMQSTKIYRFKKHWKSTFDRQKATSKFPYTNTVYTPFFDRSSGNIFRLNEKKMKWNTW